jgi:hypothetical protein
MMTITRRHRRVARTLWECGGRVEEAAAKERIRPSTVQRWLTEPAFQDLMTANAAVPLGQARDAVLRWAPAAVARLIRDLEGESAGDARQAAKEILRLAIDAERELGLAAEVKAGPAEAEGEAGARDDPLGRRVAAMTDAQLARVMEMINGSG